MNRILTSVSYLFHPLFLPFTGTGIYYNISSKYYPSGLVYSRLFQICVLTIIIPLLIFRTLKKLGFISSLMAENIKERKIPYGIAVLINGYICYSIFNQSLEIELHYFFLGITACSINFFILSLFNFKASLHTAAMGGILTFFIGLSLHFQLNLNLFIFTTIILTGLVASSRLYLKAHDELELITGLAIGVITQLLFLSNWV